MPRIPFADFSLIDSFAPIDNTFMLRLKKPLKSRRSLIKNVVLFVGLIAASLGGILVIKEYVVKPVNQAVLQGSPDNTDPTWNVGPTSTEGRIKSMIRNRVDAWNARDVRRYMADYRNFEALSVSLAGQKRKGWDEVKEFIKTQYGDDMGTMSLKDIVVEMVGKQGAIVTAQWSLNQSQKITAGGLSLVLNRVESQWKITNEIQTSR